MNILGDRGLVADLKRSVTSAELSMTIEGASTLTLKVRDYTRSLLRSPIARTRARLILDGIEYTLVKVGHEGDEITLIFEETAVNLLRRYRKPRKANRANTTRAQFIEGMVREVTERAIPFRCPELDRASNDPQTGGSGDPGESVMALTVKGKPPRGTSWKWGS